MAEANKVVAPNLPNANPQWDARWQEHFNNVLRLYFNSVNNALNVVVSPEVLELTDGVTAPVGGDGRAVIYVDSADGDLKIRFADGTIKTIITDT